MLSGYLVLDFLLILRGKLGELNDVTSLQIKFDFERGMWYHL